MKEIDVLPFTTFQKDRVVQLQEGIRNINNIEGIMQVTKQEVVFIGPEDHEEQIDKTTLMAWKGGIAGVYRELKAEGMKNIADQIIF